METTDDPLQRVRMWWEAARRHEPEDAEAAALATVNAEGAPSVRMVLVRGIARGEFLFYTNLGSCKAKDLARNPAAALCFHWKSLHRQLRVEGNVRRIAEEEADEYFASRVRESQIGAWASRQSETLANRFELETRIQEVASKFAQCEEVRRPPFWSGFRIEPSRIEFWESGLFRLHERLAFHCDEGKWVGELLFP